MRLTSKIKAALLGSLAILLVGCGQAVEVPPAHVGKIMTKDGYQDNLIPTSKFRMDACWAYCDRLVLLDVSDKAFRENLSIFIPKDKLNLGVDIQATLSINPNKTTELFSSLSPQEISGFVSRIENQQIYRTYASQIIQKEVREYLSQYSIAEIASSNERINSDLQVKLSDVLSSRTPFSVRFVGITGLTYPKIITDAQEAAAKRREDIQQEQAKLEISQTVLTRQLKEAQLQRAIDKEKAETEAMAQRLLAASVDANVLKLRKLENERLWIERWDGQVPTTMLGEGGNMMMMMGNK